MRPKVLVTGGHGFIGSHVVTALGTCDVSVAPLPRPVNYHDREAVDQVLRQLQPSILIHCAWHLADGSAYLTDPGNDDEVAASLQLFRLAHAAGCRRVVGIGTCLEYEESPGRVREDAPLCPRTAYGASKAALFNATEAWAQEAGCSFSWARLYYPYGPREAAHRLVPTVVNGLLRGERVPTTAGEQRRSFLFAGDVADAIAAIALADVVGAVNVGADRVIAVRELVERIGTMLGRRGLLDIGAIPARLDDPDVLWPDVEKLTSIVKFRPSRDLETGLEETIAWWRAQR
jgi:nucleoside-diphosphate-sugar epimerase